MAEVADMGEVDEMHSTEEGVIVNGDISNEVDMESHESQDSIKKSSNPESMDVDPIDSDNETSETKEGNTESITTDDSNDNTADDSVSTENQSTDSEESSQDGKEIEDISKEPAENLDLNDKETSPSSPKSVEDERHSTEDGGEKDSNSPATVENDSNSMETTEDNSQDAPSEKTVNSNKDEISEGAELEKEQDQEGIMTKDDTKENGAEAVDDLHKSNSSIEVHNVDDKSEKDKEDETVELNSDSEDGDVMIVDSPKTNGTSHEVIDLVETPEKKKYKKRIISGTPRRSSRNINKNKSYAESDREDTPPRKQLAQPSKEENEMSEESDVEEVVPQDPLAVNDQITVERIPLEKVQSSATIVVKDTKRLVEIASKSNTNSPSGGGKKEPTLVIIDTNSILSGRGPVPINKPIQNNATANFPTVLPVAVPTQSIYPTNMRATITPIPVNTSQVAVTTVSKTVPATITPTPPPPLLPTLTDDMFVVEAPSFIVPYVYEKPPIKVLKEFVVDLKKQIQSNKKSKKETEDEKTEGESKEKRNKEKKEEDDNDSKDNESKEESESEEESDDEKVDQDPRKPYNYFRSPLGKFFMDIGFNMVQEFVQSDLLKQQKRKREREQGANPETNKAIASLIKNLETSKGINEHFKMEMKKCEFCNFKTESTLAMAYHLETPHMKNFVYKCNFCSYEIRSPHDILFHMEAEHAVRGHLERAPAFHQCPSCPFEDNQKGKLTKHLVVCARKFKPDRNLEPPADWEPPAKIPRMPKLRAQGLNATAAAYQAMSKANQYQFLSKMQLQSTNPALQRGRGRPSLGPNMKVQPMLRPQGMVFKPQGMSGGSVLVPTNFQMSGNQLFQNVTQKKPTNQPSISITPVPRTVTTTPGVTSKPGDTNSKNSFVICEICDGYIKDLEQLRNHMQWIHKIKIHPKMIYNRPPLNCQKCQYRFFTDQGLERHLLGTHGLVTSSMQDAANKSKDSGRCPVCGRVYQWKLLNHVARDHNMTLKPAHLSYKCTVCTATFGMYKQFENHVYSAHSFVAKRVMDKKTTSGGSTSTASKVSEMKPLKINDEITIIPQPAKSTNGAKEGSPSSSKTR